MTSLEDSQVENEDKAQELAERQRIQTRLEAIIPYLPQPVIESQLQDPEIGRVRGEYWEGAMLFADLSGFTALSEELSRLGKQGAEEITRIVNDLFGALLEDVERYGGILVKFGGDALTVYFGGQGYALRAAHTGLALQETMGRRFANIGTRRGMFTLRIRVGVHTGRIFAAQVGYEEGYPLRGMELVVTGADVNRVAEAQDYAAPGEVCITEEMLRQIAGNAEVEEVGGGMYRLERLDPLVGIETPTAVVEARLEEKALQELRLYLNTLEPYLPVDFADKRIADPSAPELRPDLRPVAVLFANFADLSGILEALAGRDKSGVEAATRILNMYYARMQEVIGRYEGIVNKVDMYTHGDKLMAVFGAPLSHGDDAERAVRAALEMQASMPEVNEYVRGVLEEAGVPYMPLTQRIGVNYGHVFAGNVGSERAGSRREYTVMGDTVNLSARLMAAAEDGDILISPAVQRQVADRFKLDELPSIQVKGKAEPILIWRPVRLLTERERAELRRGRRPFIGRRAQLEEMQEAAQQTAQGEGQVVAIVGEMGTGKTRLVEAFQDYLWELPQESSLNHYVTELPSYTQEPYAPIVDLLQRVIGLGGQTIEDMGRLREWAEARAPELAHFLPLLGALLALPIQDNPITAALTPEQRRDRLFDLVEAALHGEARQQALVLVVDDLQRGDESSLALLERLTKGVGEVPLMIVLCHWPDVSFATPWVELSHTHALQITEFSPEESKWLVAELLETEVLPEGLAEMVWARAQGNPFFAEEFVKSLRETEAIVRRDDGWQLVGGEAALTAIPDTIEGIVLARLDRLEARCRDVLQEASVVATSRARFTGSLLERVDRQPVELGERLHVLVSEGLLETLETELEALEYHFRHTLTQDVAYDSLLYARRRELHGLIAQVMEEVYRDRLGEYVGSLAHHYLEAEEWPRAFEYARRAGERTQALYANKDAIAQFVKALKVAEERLSTMLAAMTAEELGEALTDVHEGLGDVLLLEMRYEEALEHFALARAMVGAETPSAEQMGHLADLCRKSADVHERRSEYEEAFEWLGKGLGYLKEDEPTIEAARIYNKGAGVYQRQGKNDEATVWCQKSLEVASEIETREGQQVVGHAYYLLGLIYYRRGDLQRAVQFCRESVQVYQGIDDIGGLSQAYINLGNAYGELGDWDRASDALRESLAIKQKMGDKYYQAVITHNLGDIHLDRGEWTEAARLFEQSDAIWKQVGAANMEAITLSNLGQVYIFRENWSEAQANLSRSQAIFADVGSDEYLPELERRWGEYYLKIGEPDQALTRTRRSIELAVAKEARLEEGMSHRVLGEIHLARGEMEAAEAALYESLEILSDLNSEYQVARTLLCLVQWAVARRPTAATQTQLAQAINTFEKLGAQAYLDQARDLKQQVERGAEE